MQGLLNYQTVGCFVDRVLWLPKIQRADSAKPGTVSRVVIKVLYNH